MNLRKIECDQYVERRGKSMAIQARYCQRKARQLVCRLQRHSGRPENPAGGLFADGLKIRDEHRRWTKMNSTRCANTLPPIGRGNGKSVGAKREVGSLRATEKRMKVREFAVIGCRSNRWRVFCMSARTEILS